MTLYDIYKEKSEYVRINPQSYISGNAVFQTNKSLTLALIDGLVEMAKDPSLATGVDNSNRRWIDVADLLVRLRDERELIEKD